MSLTPGYAPDACSLRKNLGRTRITLRPAGEFYAEQEFAADRLQRTLLRRSRFQRRLKPDVRCATLANAVGLTRRGQWRLHPPQPAGLVAPPGAIHETFKVPCRIDLGFLLAGAFLIRRYGFVKRGRAGMAHYRQ